MSSELNSSPLDSRLCLLQEFRTPMQGHWLGHLDLRGTSWSQSTQDGDVLNRMACLVAAAQDNELAVAAEREPGWRRAGSPQASTGSGGRPHWTPAAVGVFAAPAQHLPWQDWRVSSASQVAQQNNGRLLDFPYWLIPECPCSHPCCSSHHCPLQQGKESSSSCPSWQLSFLSTAPCLPSSSPRTSLATLPSSLVQVLQTCIALALLSCFPTDSWALGVLGGVLLSLVLAPELNRDDAACSSSCFLCRKAERDRDPIQSNDSNL